MCTSCWPGIYYVSQAGLELSNLSASNSWVLGLKGMCHHAESHSDSLASFTLKTLSHVGGEGSLLLGKPQFCTVTTPQPAAIPPLVDI